MNKIIVASILIVLGYACNPPTNETSMGTNVPDKQASVEIAKPEVSVTNEQIAKAAISALYHQPAKIMSVQTKGDIVLVSYIRSDDGQKFQNKIQIINNTINWGNFDGRWRTSPYDEKLSYSTVGQELVITTTYSDGSKTQERYKIKDL